MSEDIGTINKKIDDLTAVVHRLSQNFESNAASAYTVNTGPGDVNASGLTKSSLGGGYTGPGVTKSGGDGDFDDFKQDFSKDENEERGNWTGKFDFFLSCLGYAVGLGNVWRFPYLAYQNGGAVFFIPYVIMLVFVGMPIFVMELSLGQYTSSGPLTCWTMAPAFKGIGLGMVTVSALVAIYYNMIIAWAIYYTFASFTSDLPWQGCNHEWNTPFCSELLNKTINSSTICFNMGLNASVNGVCYNGSTPVGIWDKETAKNETYNIKSVLPSEEYFVRNVLGKSDSISELGTPRWQLVLCLIAAWVIVCLSLIKGVKSSGKVVYFTAIFPYVVLIILFVLGMTLDGHKEGIEFYILQPNVTKLSEAKVWKDAAVQIFFSLSASWGGLITLASYNRYHNDCVRDSIIVSISNCLTSFFAGFVIFSFIGFLAKQEGVPIEEVVQSGSGLAFVVYTAAVTLMPVPPLWAILFFIMLITLGLDSEFALVETVTTAIMDQFPILRKRKALVIIACSVVMFLLGLTMTCPGGQYFLDLMDTYSGGWNVMVIALLECICITYVYGAFRFREDIRSMIGDKTFSCIPWTEFSPWWIICWGFFTPVGVLFIMIFSWIQYEPLYSDQPWADVLGWLMTFTVIAGILIGAVWAFLELPGSFSDRMSALFTRSRTWGPALVKHRKGIKHLPNFVVDPYTDSYEMSSEPYPSVRENYDPSGETNRGFH